MSNDAILPTKHRDAHSKEVGYVVGAERLSAACAGVPQWSNLALHFASSASHARLRDALTFPIAEVTFRRRPPSHREAASAEPAELEGQWEIWVFAVPVEQKHAIQTALVDEFLPEVVVPWLRDSYRFRDHFGTMTLRLEFNATTSEVTRSATQDLTPPRI